MLTTLLRDHICMILPALAQRRLPARLPYKTDVFLYKQALKT